MIPLPNAASFSIDSHGNRHLQRQAAQLSGIASEQEISPYVVRCKWWTCYSVRIGASRGQAQRLNASVVGIV
jgi:hypothetical protein